MATRPSRRPSAEVDMRVEASQVIERPKATVFRFVAREHVLNHPRWDPDIKLRLDSDDPVRVGAVIRRWNSHSGKVVEGTMEVVEFAPEERMSTVIREGPVEVHGAATFEALGPRQTRLTISADMPAMPADADPSPIRRSMERSVARIKELIEAET
jgi:hypothetical protein